MSRMRPTLALQVNAKEISMSGMGTGNYWCNIYYQDSIPGRKNEGVLFSTISGRAMFPRLILLSKDSKQSI